jgi:hypothetical protein
MRLEASLGMWRRFKLVVPRAVDRRPGGSALRQWRSGGWHGGEQWLALEEEVARPHGRDQGNSQGHRAAHAGEQVCLIPRCLLLESSLVSSFTNLLLGCSVDVIGSVDIYTCSFSWDIYLLSVYCH